MANIKKRMTERYKVSVGPEGLGRIASLRANAAASSKIQRMSGRLNRVFRSLKEAEELVEQYRDLGVRDVAIKSKVTTAWQARIRITGAPWLTASFRTKGEADQWVREREGEIAKRSFVDYREAERCSLADLLMRYDRDNRGTRPKDDPDRVRLRMISSHPLGAIRMAFLQPSDLCTYRDERLKGTATAPAVKGTTVKKDLELICRVIGLAIREWNIHLAFNPASAQRVARPAAAPGDVRDRRLELAFVPLVALEMQDGASKACKSRRVSGDADFERDPEVEELLAMPQSEQQALLRAARYAHWFTQVKRSTNVATLRRRAGKKLLAPIKARQRKGGRHWAFFSFAIETAMRRGEMCKLLWGHVHLTDGYILLPGAITKNRKDRIVPLTLRARRILSTQPRASERVFDTTTDAIKSAFRRARERVGITGLRQHDLKHEGVSRLFEVTNLRGDEISGMTGNTDARTLARYYNKRPAEFVRRFNESRKQPRMRQAQARRNDRLYRDGHLASGVV